MTTLIEKSILNERLEKSRSGTYADTSENRRKHRVGQKYGSEKKEEEKPEKTSSNEKDPAKELEAVDKVIAAINEGKLKLPQEEIMVLIEKKNNLELAKRQAEKIHSGVKANEEKRNAAEAKETSKKINEAQKEAHKQEASGKAPEGVTQASYDSITKNAKATQRGYTLNIDGKDVRVERTIDTSGGQRTPVYQIQGMDKKYWDLGKMIEAYRKDNKASETDKEDLREARKKYDKEADEIRSEIDKLYESDHPDAAKKRKELWNTLKEKTNKYDAETSRLKDEYEAEYKKLDEAEDKLYDQRQKEETSEEVKESYTRVKFEDVPNSGKVNLKKYLSEKVRKGVDEKWSNIKNIPTDNLKKMEKGLVNDLNKNFEAIKKSQRAELLYSIMIVKGELEKRGKESQKKE